MRYAQQKEQLIDAFFEAVAAAADGWNSKGVSQTAINERMGTIALEACSGLFAMMAATTSDPVKTMEHWAAVTPKYFLAQRDRASNFAKFLEDAK